MIKDLCLYFVLVCSSLSSFGQHNLKGLEWEDDFYANLPLKISYFKHGKLPPSTYSIKAQCPRVATQSSFNTSVAWASVWFGRTILDAFQKGWKDNALITSQAYSPAFNYRLVNSESGCEGAVKLSSVLESLRNDGAILFGNFNEFCATDIPDEIKSAAAINKLPGYVRLFYSGDSQEKKILAIKEAIAEDHPVLLGLTFPPSFALAGEFWQPRGEPDRDQNGHVVTVVGYSDSKFGGAIEVVNSWGSTWGQKGFSWILYKDIHAYARYGVELLDINHENRPLESSLNAISSEGNVMPVNLNAKGLYQFKYSYPTGTRFKITVDLNQQAFFYLIGFDNSWTPIKMYPSEEGIAAWVPKGFLKIGIPEAPSDIELFDPAGRNYFCMIVSGSQIDIERYIVEINERKENFFKEIYNKDNKGIVWGDDHVALKMPFKRESIAAILIELAQVPK